VGLAESGWYRYVDFEIGHRQWDTGVATLGNNRIEERISGRSRKLERGSILVLVESLELLKFLVRSEGESLGFAGQGKQEKQRKE
jgi:hypothetical protein